MSILYKYHISHEPNCWVLQGTFGCRSFISIIFPSSRKLVNMLDLSVSILYKYHISLVETLLINVLSGTVSILYKYHISLTKYSTFWTLIAENVEKRSILAYIFRPSPVFRLFSVLKLAQIKMMVENSYFLVFVFITIYSIFLFLMSEFYLDVEFTSKKPQSSNIFSIYLISSEYIFLSSAILSSFLF